MGVEGETMTVFSTRKSPRLKGFDYSFPTAYFITICTHEKVCLFGQPERLNHWGEIADRCVGQISVHYSCVTIEKYVVMPNHVHMLLFVDFSKLPDEQLRPNITSIVGKYKAAVSREIHRIDPAIKVWQRDPFMIISHAVKKPWRIYGTILMTILENGIWIGFTWNDEAAA